MKARQLGDMTIMQALEVVTRFDPLMFFPETTETDWAPHRETMPADAMDPKTGEQVLDLLLELNRQHGTALVIVTHSPLLLGACRVVVVLDRGRLVRGGPPQEALPEIFGHPGTDTLVKRPA